MKANSIRLFPILIFAGLISAGAASSQDPKPRADGATNRVLEQFSVFKDGDALLLPVQIEGKKYSFVVDTGAGWSAFDTSLLLGRPLETTTVDTPTGISNVELYRPPEAAIGKMRFPGRERVVGLDFAKWRQISGHPIFGIIGMDFLARRVLQIDFDAGTLLFLQSPGQDAGQPVPISIRDTRPYVVVQTLGGSFEFLVDTGYVGGSGWVDRSLFDEAVRADQLKVVCTALSTDLSGDSRKRYGQAAHLRLGDFKIPRPCLGEGNGQALGLDLWRRFVVTFDFPKNVVYLQQGKNFDRPDRWDRSGLHVLRDDGKTVVESTDKGSVSERAGLKALDEILKVSGRDASELTLFEIRRLFTIPGESIPLVIRRDGKDYQATLKLAD